MRFDASRPIWLQLVTEFKERIAAGSWPLGQKIPGVRELALSLGVNPNTVQRALAQLEQESLCRSERAVGRYVTGDAQRVTSLRGELGSVAAKTYVERCRSSGLNLAQCVELIEQHWPAAEEPIGNPGGQPENKS